MQKSFLGAYPMGMVILKHLCEEVEAFIADEMLIGIVDESVETLFGKTMTSEDLRHLLLQ